jgi:hypothetical protein
MVLTVMLGVEIRAERGGGGRPGVTAGPRPRAPPRGEPPWLRRTLIVSLRPAAAVHGYGQGHGQDMAISEDNSSR